MDIPWDENTYDNRVVQYGWVSSYDQRDDLDRQVPQVARLTEWVTKEGMAVNEVADEYIIYVSDTPQG